MTDKFLTFRQFHDQDVAFDFIQQLRDFSIDFRLEDTDQFFDPSFAKNPSQRDFTVKLKSVDFPVAQRALENYYQRQTDSANPEHYLFHFTNEELKEILEKSDEWGDLDYQLAQKILKDRGYEINVVQVEDLQKKRNNELAMPEKMHKGWVYFGYFSALLGGFFGIIIGWYLYYSKKTLPDGRYVYNYRDWERKHGKLILILGNIFLPVWLLIKLAHQS